MNKKIIIFGASGFIGQHLIQFFLNENKWEVKELKVVVVEHRTKIVLKDITPEERLLLKTVGFDSPELVKELMDVDVIINLCGANIADKAWTEARKKILWDSRVKTTKSIKAKLIAALSSGEKSSDEGIIKKIFQKRSKQKDLVFINASAVGYYTNFEDKNGNSKDEVKNENSPKGQGFLSDLTDAWEKSAVFIEAEKDEVPAYNIRTVILRIGLVLGKGGGALPPILTATRLFAGAVIGSGTQPVPWIAVKEIPAIVNHIIATPSLSGPVNVVAPQSINFTYFAKQIGKYANRPVFLKAPEFVLKLALQQRADLILKGDNVYPSVLLNSGYEFKYPNLPEALRGM